MPLYKKPSLKVEIDFSGNPTAKFADILNGADNAVSFWRINSSSTFLDERDSNNDGVILGSPSSIAGPFPYDSDTGRTFDGVDDGAYVPSSASLSIDQAMSVEVWVRLASLPGSTKDVMTKRGSWVISVNSSGKVVAYIKDDTSIASITSTATLTTGAWHYIALVYTGAAVNLYIDGTLDTTAAYSSGLGLTGLPVRFAHQTDTAATWVSSTSSQNISSTVTATKPAVSVGDLLLVYMHFGFGSSTVPTVTTPQAGWTLVASAPMPAGQAANSALYMRVVDGTEGASFTWTLSTGCTWTASITKVTGADTVAPIASVFATAYASGTTYSTGAHRTNMPSSLLLTYFSSEQPSTWTQSSGTERVDASTASNSHCLATQTANDTADITVTGTQGAGSDIGAAYFVEIAGATTFTAVSLDDAGFWNAALSASDVASHYAARNSGTGTWVDVSTDVRQVQIRGGRQYELDRMEARSATVVLQDELRKYDPANQSSPYWPNVVPMKRIRVSLTHSAVTYPIFTGFVERWPPETIGPRYQEVNLSAVDGFDGLSRASIGGAIASAFGGAQIDTILNKAYWPEADRNLDAGQYVMIGDSDINTTALQAIQDIADSELGVFFIDGQGRATFHDRAHRGTSSRSTTSQVSFVEASNSTVTYHQLTPSFDRDRIINTWEVSPHSAVPGGTVQTATDPDSISRYFLRTASRSTKLASNTDALAQANQLLNETAQPALRFDSLVVVPYTDAQWAALLPLQISDRVTVTRTPVPSAGGTTIVRDCFIEGMSWTITPSQIQLALQLSPVSSGDYYHTIVRDGPGSYWRMDTVT